MGRREGRQGAAGLEDAPRAGQGGRGRSVWVRGAEGPATRTSSELAWAPPRPRRAPRLPRPLRPSGCEPPRLTKATRWSKHRLASSRCLPPWKLPPGFAGFVVSEVPLRFSVDCDSSRPGAGCGQAARSRRFRCRSAFATSKATRSPKKAEKGRPAAAKGAARNRVAPVPATAPEALHKGRCAPAAAAPANCFRCSPSPGFEGTGRPVPLRLGPRRRGRPLWSPTVS